MNPLCTTQEVSFHHPLTLELLTPAINTPLMDVLVKPTHRHHANCSLCMQMLDTLFGREEDGGREGGGAV